MQPRGCRSEFAPSNDAAQSNFRLFQSPLQTSQPSDINNLPTATRADDEQPFHHPIREALADHRLGNSFLCSLTSRLGRKVAATSLGGQRRANAASQPVTSVSGEAVFEGSELMIKQPSGATSYCQFAIRSAAMRV